MKVLIFILLVTNALFGVCMRSLGADQEAEAKQLLAMQAVLKAQGIESFVRSVPTKGWTTPLIYSRWHVEHVTPNDERPVELSKREMGGAMAKQLSALAPTLQNTKSADELFNSTTTLLDLSDWCASTEGYGNLLLARRCLDLASVGIARLVCDSTFPMEKCEVLAKRLEVPWMDIDVRRRVLNEEAGAEIFPKTSKQQEDMEKTWASGKWLHSEQRDPSMKKQRLLNPFVRVTETPNLLQHLDFFVGYEEAPPDGPVTVLSTWELKYHDLFAVTGLELQNVTRVKALFAFRRAIGYFPTTDVPASPDRGSRGAFREAWRNQVFKMAAMSNAEWNQQLNQWAGAWQAWNEVQQGDFLDEDTRAEKSNTAPVKPSP